MTQPAPTALDIVGAYLTACSPPQGCPTGEVVRVVNAWNEIAAKVRAMDAPPAAPTP